MTPEQQQKADRLKAWFNFNEPFFNFEWIAQACNIRPFELWSWANGTRTVSPTIRAPWPESFADLSDLEAWARVRGFRYAEDKEEAVQVEIRMMDDIPEPDAEEILMNRLSNAIGKALVKKKLFSRGRPQRNPNNCETTHRFALILLRP